MATSTTIIITTTTTSQHSPKKGCWVEVVEGV